MIWYLVQGVIRDGYSAPAAELENPISNRISTFLFCSAASQRVSLSIVEKHRDRAGCDLNRGFKLC